MAVLKSSILINTLPIKEPSKFTTKDTFRKIRVRQSKYLNYRVEVVHRFIRWRVHQMVGFKNFESAQSTLTGIKIVRWIKKGQITFPTISTFTTFCSLAESLIT